MNLKEYALNGIKEANNIIDNLEQKINHEYWKGKRIVYESILQILERNNGIINNKGLGLNLYERKNCYYFSIIKYNFSRR